MVGRTVGSRWQVLYGTVYFSRWPVSLSPLQYEYRTAAADESYWCGELSNASTVPYHTVPYGVGVSLLSYLLLVPYSCVVFIP